MFPIVNRTAWCLAKLFDILRRNNVEVEKLERHDLQPQPHPLLPCLQKAYNIIHLVFGQNTSISGHV